MATDFLTDPFWYKDAVIYELHVRSFFDSDNNGYGDFEGLRRKLPYIESLGVNAIWLLPFLESPLRDDGYDTADYCKILPVHGTLEQFKAFLDEAHALGLRVITELVLNHTSDQHPWFQEARDPASPRHDWYVWSETTEKYREARIIFTDTEVSNWTWDRKAGKYYWHRFFSHQPDLNFDNPEVHRAMEEVLFYWLDMGVDGLRLDAVPYLYEREGTSCENLPETIGYVQKLRAAIEERYGPGRVLLAEANQWPEDTVPYFGGGQGVQMAFNFPIMPRLYMSLRRESRYPLVEMLELTKDIPEASQWAIFLRNHDELTLEMVTDEERDYMYYEYAADPRFRINVGIRRRLAPLLGGDRRRIELLNALLLSLKGSPVIYYGDEIGMGDDPFLGDRNGVRTPMQWSPDRNGGFSRAPHHRLFMPPIDHGPYQYEFVNVEDSEADPASLLQFMKRLLGFRKQHEKIFGRGSFTILPVDNPSILAFVRAYEGEQILVVANLSRFAQSAFLPVMDGYRGLVPVELFSQNPFPPFGDAPYHFPLAPHGFCWFVLKPQEAVVHGAHAGAEPALEGAEPAELPAIEVAEGLHNLLVRTMVRDRGMERLETLLPDYIKDQRWFGSKDQTIRRVRLHDAVRLQTQPLPAYLAILQVDLSEASDLYLLPLALSRDDEAERILRERPRAALAWVDGPDGRALLHDATVSPEFWRPFFRWWQSGRNGRSLQGLYQPQLDPALRDAGLGEVRIFSGEQSNSSAVLDRRFYVKLYRRLEDGTNPETELLSYLTDAGFKFTPKLYGTLTFKRPDRTYNLGIVQEALAVEGDGWEYALEVATRFLDRVASAAPPRRGLPGAANEPPAWVEELAPEMLSLTRTLGTRTAEMHKTFARATAPDLQPEAASPDDLSGLAARIRAEAERTRQMMGELAGDHRLPPDEAWEQAFTRLDHLADLPPALHKIRVHGDYHLGQVARAEGEFYILDLEGEPARSLPERRQRDYALRDVAGMLRSIEYAALSTWKGYEAQTPALEQWITELARWCAVAFLDAYYTTAAGANLTLARADDPLLLWAYLLDKALYEVRYELSHRPDWTWLPLHGLRHLLDPAGTDGQSDGGPRTPRTIEAT